MILGISLNGINVERKEFGEKEFKVSYESEIKEIKETKVPAVDDKVAELLFNLKVTYQQDNKAVGSFTFDGGVIWKGDFKELQKKWEEDKKLPEGVGVTILNAIYRRCLVTSVGLAEQVGLPSPIPLPKVGMKK